MVTAEVTPHEEVRVIDSRQEYFRAIDSIAEGTGPVAVDAERASGFRYSQRAYLIQMFRNDAGTFLFDPPAIGDFSDLNSAINQTEWVLHAASQDLNCLREVGLDPLQIFDTELGARLAGLPRVGLGTVVEELLGIHLAKEHSAADWSTRPLPESWLIYAALDVELLVDLRGEIAKLLFAQDKSEIAAQEFRATLEKEAKPAAAEPWRRLSGMHNLRDARAMAIARALWEARDALAIETDTAAGRLLPDASIIAVSKNPPASQRDLAATREFTGRTSRSQLDRWWKALESGLAAQDLPEVRPHGEGIPPARVWSDKKPEADARLKRAKAEFAELSEKLSIPMENLLTPDLLRRISWEPPADLQELPTVLREGGARPWQIDLAVPAIRKAFVEAAQADTESAEQDS
ncbi:MAG: ribonuclease D [Cryobacterium sp.]|nr:ribonuclease D [Cryobacterium sp.]